MWNSSFQARIGASSLSQRMQRIETSRNRCDFQGLLEQIASRLASPISLFFYFFFFRSEKCLKMIRNTAFPPFIPQGTVRKVFFFQIYSAWIENEIVLITLQCHCCFSTNLKWKYHSFVLAQLNCHFSCFEGPAFTILLSLLVTSWCWIPKKTS